MKRIAKPLVVAAIVLQASFAQALGLGDITLKSSLNEPLKAEIRLRGAGDLNADQIVVRLATPGDFQRAGVERLYSLSEISFEVQLSSRGDGVIQLHTARPVREPYLDFVVEVRWPTGRVLREYTMLIDLPTTTPTPAPAVRAPAAARPATGAQRAPGRVSGGGTWTGGERYEVRSGETLWSISNRTRPAGVSVQQMMVALQRGNQDAFIRGNMNLLRAGAVLRIPADAAVTQIEAVGEVQTQDRDWRSGGGTETAAREQPAPSPAAPSAATGGSASATERAYLELAAGADGAAGGSASGGEAGGTGSGSIKEQLTATQENLSAKERENAELQSRVAALEQQVQNYERLVELKSEGGAAAQQAAAAAADGSPAAADGADKAPATPAPGTAASSTPAAAGTAADPGILAKVMDNAVMLAAVFAALVIGAVVLLVARRRATDYAPVPDTGRAALRTAAAKPAEAPAAPAKAPARQEPRMADAPKPSAPAPAPAPVPAPAAEAAAVAAAATAAATAAVAGRAAEPDVSDPVSEADIYIAYGRTERAIEILRAALVQDPGRSDVRLKLMEVLVDAGNQDAFLEQYDQLSVHGDAAAEDAVREMLDDRGMSNWLADDEPLAELAAYSPPATVAAPPPAPPPAPVEDDAPALASIETEGGVLHLDQDVDLDLDQELARATEEPVGDEDLALELGELDLGSMDEPHPGAAAAAAELEPLGDLELGGDPAPLAAAPPSEPPGGSDDDADLGLLEGSDEIETKLELARAYVDMGDFDGARDILDEVLAEGSAQQREHAGAMLERIRSA